VRPFQAFQGWQFLPFSDFGLRIVDFGFSHPFAPRKTSSRANDHSLSGANPKSEIRNVSPVRPAQAPIARALSGASQRWDPTCYNLRMRYKVGVEKSEEGYSVWVPGLPGCWSEGATEEEALANISEAIVEYLSVVEEQLTQAEIREIEVAV